MIKSTQLLAVAVAVAGVAKWRFAPRGTEKQSGERSERRSVAVPAVLIFICPAKIGRAEGWVERVWVGPRATVFF